MLNKDFLVNLSLVLFDVVNILILGYIFITNILNVAGLCALVLLALRVHHSISDLYCLVCQNYKTM